MLIAAHRKGMTANQQKVADYVLANPFPVATMGIEELSAATETSPATITRFVKNLGLAGFSEFRALAVQGYHSLLKPLESLDRARELSAADVARNSFENAVQTINTLSAQADNPIWQDVANKIVAARTVAFLGLGVSANVLRIFADQIINFNQSQLMLNGSGGSERMAQKISFLRPDDLLITMALPRYSQATVDFLKLARGRGAYCIAVTDNEHSPLCAHSHEAILIPAQHPVLHATILSAIAVFEAITAVLASHHQSAAAAVSATRSLLPYLYADDLDAPADLTRNTDVSERQ